MRKHYLDIDFKDVPDFALSTVAGILVREGDEFTNHVEDWPTKYGIRQLSADRAGYTGKIEDINEYIATKIWLSLFWYGPNMHMVAEVSELIAETVMDTSGPAGLGVGIRHLQMSLTSFNVRIGDGPNFRYGPDLVIDSVIGSKTCDQLDRYLSHRKVQGGELKLAMRLNCLQDTHYIQVALNNPGKRAFSFGWTTQRVYLDMLALLDNNGTTIV